MRCQPALGKDGKREIKMRMGLSKAALLVLALVATNCVREKIREVVRVERVPVTPGVTHPPTGSGDGPSLDASIFPQPGSTQFITANENELLSSGLGVDDYWDRSGTDVLGGVANDAAGAQPPSQEAEPMPEPDPSREIVEADLFKVEGSLVYALNRYRGLVIVDLSEPDAPVIRGRLPFQAVPVEMYVREGRAYVVMSDYFTYWMYDPDADPLGFHGSQVLIADVSDPDHPKALGSLPVDGEITDTRMVGDVIYAVSKRRPDYWRYNTADWQDTTWVVSLNIADPNDIFEVDRIAFDGTSTLIHVAPHAIFVAATDPNYYLYDSAHQQETLVTYVDISDPNGDIQERGHVYIPGRIQDKFKMDYYDHSLRVLAQNWTYASQGSLVVVDLSYPDNLQIVGTLPIGQDVWGSMQASRFSGERAYALTYRWSGSQPYYDLHVFDLAEPTAPAESGVLRVDGYVTHFEVADDNTRLLALGSANYGTEWRTTLTLYDVANPAAPSELSQVYLGDGYSSSSANYDYKALQILRGMNLILLPLNYWSSSTGSYFTGTQLVDWVGDALTQRGRVDNIDTVQRAFPVGARAVTLSTKRIQVLNIDDRDHPAQTAALDLIRNVYQVFSIQGYEVQLVGDVYSGGIELDVLPFAADDDAPILARLQLPFVGAPVCFQRGNLIHMIGWEGTQTVRTADFSSVLYPSLRGQLQLASEIERIYTPGGGYYYYYWNPRAGLPLENRILPFTVRQLVEDASGRRDYQSELRLIDMSDPDNPRIADGAVPMNDYPFINKVTHGNVLYSTHVEQATTDGGSNLLYHVRAYVDRIDVSDPDHPIVLPSLNVPGSVVDVAHGGDVLLTVDYQWDDFGRRRNSLNSLAIVGNEAMLMEVLPVSDQVNRAVYRDDTIWLTTHKYPWWGVHSDTVESRQPYTVLNRVRIADDGTMPSFTQARIQGYHFDLLDVDGSLAYLASNYPYGVLVLNVSDASAPTIVTSSRTVGYISRIVTFGDYIYSPLGLYGVRRMSRAAEVPTL